MSPPPDPAAVLPRRHALALGLLHGPAELLPVSSSGHVTLVPWLLGWPYPELDPDLRKAFEVALHAGTALGLLIALRHEVGEAAHDLDRRRLTLIAGSFVPPAIVGLTLEGPIERRLGTPGSIALGLLIGSVAMTLADTRCAQERTREDATATDALLLGLAQASALMPGTSRGGMTLAAMRARRFTRTEASALSRHVALPVIAGASLLKGVRLCPARPPARDDRPLRAGNGGLDGLDARRRADRPRRARRGTVAVRGLSRGAGGRHAAASARIGAMSDAYAAAGVDTNQSDRAVSAIVGVLRTIETGAPSRVVDLPGHYASVLRVSDALGIAIATDGVGSKLVLAEQTGRLDSVGIDCIAMNVNDLVCVGAEPIAMVDYLAVEQADPAATEAIARGLAIGAADAGIEIPGGELAVLPELIRGHPSPSGFDLCGTAIGTVALDAIITGDAHRTG